MNKSDVRRNRFMLKGPLATKGYDWWWHSFTGYKRSNGEARSFFIEYFVCNPALGGEKPAFGQIPDHPHVKPSYALIKAGYWGKESGQIHNFYGIRDFRCGKGDLDLSISHCTLTEKRMKGSCSLTEEEAKNHPEYMSDWGSMGWDLGIDKKIAFHVGYGASPFFRAINAFEMYWHAEGMKTEYSGEMTLNGEVYDVIPEKSFGYSDKNWGADFTSPWLWISSCRMESLVTGKALLNSAVEMGGGNPRVYGLSLGRKLLGSLFYEGELFEYNFSKFWTGTKIDFRFTEGESVNRWSIGAQNRSSRMELTLECKKEEMLLINYEAPDGRKRHNRLWNGGTGYGEIKLYRKKRKKLTLIDHMAIKNTGCEYGEYASP